MFHEHATLCFIADPIEDNPFENTDEKNNVVVQLVHVHPLRVMHKDIETYISATRAALNKNS